MTSEPPSNRPLPSAVPRAAPPLSLGEMVGRADEVSDLLKTLAHPNRLMIVCKLVEGEKAVGTLEAELGIHQPTLSQQLTVLRRAGIVSTRRQAKQVFYSLAETRLAELVAALYDIFCELPPSDAAGERGS